MDKQTYKDSVQQEIANTIDRLLPHGGGATITETSLRSALDALAICIANRTRAYELLGIRTSDEMAEVWGVSKRRAQAHIAKLHDRFGVGRKVGRDWLLSADEAERHPPRTTAGRPKREES